MRPLPVLAAFLGLGLASQAAAQPAAPAQPAPGQPAPAQPQPAEVVQPAKPGKVTSVCPGKLLPLAVGNTWTYEAVQARDSQGNPVPAREPKQRLPLPATKIVVTVTGAETKDQETTVKLKETISYDITKDPSKPKLFDVTVESTIVCSKRGKFDISPESFFFAGEPGGYRGMAFTKFERKKETTLKLVNNTIGDREWIEEIVAEYTKEAAKGSGAKLGGGKLEMERKFVPQDPEGVRTRTALYPRTEKLRLTTSGRVKLDQKVSPDGKPCTVRKPEETKPAAPGQPAPKQAGDKKAEPTPPKMIEVPVEDCPLPADWDLDLWIADSFGVVQTLHWPWGHMYQLVEAKLN